MGEYTEEMDDIYDELDNLTCTPILTNYTGMDIILEQANLEVGDVVYQNGCAVGIAMSNSSDSSFVKVKIF